MNTTNAQERRRFFRVDDEVVMDFQTISRDEYEQWRANHQLQSTELKQLEHDISLLIHQLRSSNPALGQLLELFNRKMNLLHAHPHTSEGKALSQNEARIRVNLSACGMAFFSDTDLRGQTHLLLNLQLKPSNATLSLAGDIVAIDEVSHDYGRFQVRVNFNDLKEAEQEMLIQHLFQLQTRNLRQQRSDS